MSGTADTRDATPPVRVAIVDDDARIVETMVVYLRGLDCTVEPFTDPIACRDALRSNPMDILVTDLDMPGMNGLELMQQVKADHPATEVIVVTGNADKASAIGALKAGGYDFFEKPVDADELIATVTRTMRYQQAVADRDRMAQQLAAVSQREAAKWGLDAFVGRSHAIGEVVRSIRLVQDAPKTSVLITGESGTGKELVARAIHFGGCRSRGPFIPVNCSALPAELAESVLFGHVRGAFTGATADKKGCFEEADGGTVFLDEIGDMPMAIQAKLLRVLEDGIVVPVGKSSGRQVDVRVVAATNAVLSAKVEAGTFRSDLFFRLGGYGIEVPPLRERTDDIPLLAGHFVETFSAEMGLPPPGIAPETLNALSAHTFPGNVRAPSVQTATFRDTR